MDLSTTLEQLGLERSALCWRETLRFSAGITNITAMPSHRNGSYPLEREFHMPQDSQIRLQNITRTRQNLTAWLPSIRGEHEKGYEHSTKANEHSGKAHESSQEAHRKSEASRSGSKEIPQVINSM